MTGVFIQRKINKILHHQAKHFILIFLRTFLNDILHDIISVLALAELHHVRLDKVVDKLDLDYEKTYFKIQLVWGEKNFFFPNILIFFSQEWDLPGGIFQSETAQGFFVSPYSRKNGTQTVPASWNKVFIDKYKLILFQIDFKEQ